jgi:hypothetical protein
MQAFACGGGEQGGGPKAIARAKAEGNLCLN